jgi:hypothetical protein
MTSSASYFLAKLSVILAIGCLSAIIAANRSDTGKDRNDTSAYAAHYYCVSSSKTLDYCRNEIGGNKYELLYERFIELLAKAFDFDRFSYVKIATAFVIYSTILLAVGLKSKNTLLSLSILILDFRFWEYGSNVLRHGFAASFVALGATLLIRENIKLSFAAKILAILSHLSAAVMLITPRKKYSIWTLIFFSCSTLAILATSNHWTPALLASSLTDYKINYYLINSEGYNFSLPTHYLFFILTGLGCYYKTKSKPFIVTFNYLVPLFFASVILGYLDASYRMASFMLPILAINIPEQISIWAENFKEKILAEEIINSLVAALLILIAYKNWEFFIIHLE